MKTLWSRYGGALIIAALIIVVFGVWLRSQSPAPYVVRHAQTAEAACTDKVTHGAWTPAYVFPNGSTTAIGTCTYVSQHDLFAP